MINFIKEVFYVLIIELFGVIGRIISYNYKQFFINLTNPKWNPNIIAGVSIRIFLAAGFAFVLFVIIKSIIN